MLTYIVLVVLAVAGYAWGKQERGEPRDLGFWFNALLTIFAGAFLGGVIAWTIVAKLDNIIISALVNAAVALGAYLISANREAGDNIM